MTTPSHDTFQERLLDLAYGELGRRDARALEQHLEGCADCRAELRRMTETRTAMSALAPEPAPERGEAILLAAAREAARSREHRPFLPSWVWGVSLGAVGLVVLGLVSVRLVGQLERPGAPPRMDAQVASGPADDAAAMKASKPRAQAAESEFVAQPPNLADKAEEAAQPAPSTGAPSRKGEAASERRKEKAVAKAAEPPGLTGQATHSDLRLRGGAGALGGGASSPAVAPQKKQAEHEERFAKGLAQDLPPPPRAAPAASEPAPAPPPSPAAPSPGAPAASLAEAPSADENDSLAPSGALEAKADRESVTTRSRASAPGKSHAAASAAALAPEDAIARRARLRAAGRLRAVTRAFASCAGETARTVELDERGAVVAVTRRGTHQGAPYQLELFYAEDGRLAAARWSSAGRVHEVRASPPGALASAAGIPAGALLPERAADAGPDAPPRCAF